MRTFTEINSQMEEIQKEIDLTSGELTDARTEYLLKKAEYELKQSKTYLTMKVTNEDWTEARLKAYSIEQSNEERIAYITAESEYKKLTNNLRSLRDKIDVLKEEGYNLRAELRSLK